MADMVKLKTQKRTVDGKAVRHLRREGIIPGVLYGPTIEAIPLQVEWTTLRPALREAGGSRLIALTIDDEAHNALVRDVQRDPIRNEVLHIDFYRVRMDVAIRTEVPVVTVGDGVTIVELGGVVAQEMNSIMVECLPGDLPAQVEVDISVLEEVGDSINVSELPELEGVVYMMNEDDTVITSSYPRIIVEEEEEEEEVDESLIEDSAEPELIRTEREDEEEES
ncbi:MAG: 50S ribosomal protein L25 [Anaerolineae bacterium]|nr:50S ribosomal protein L25 [Anaerolineae bacterium]